MNKQFRLKSFKELEFEDWEQANRRRQFEDEQHITNEEENPKELTNEKQQNRS